jgi:hypothetical protein
MLRQTSLEAEAPGMARDRPIAPRPAIVSVPRRSKTGEIANRRVEMPGRKLRARRIVLENLESRQMLSVAVEGPRHQPPHGMQNVTGQ